MSENSTMFYSGEVKAEKGVTVVLRKDNVQFVTKVECYSDRMISVKISAKPVDIVIVRVYMPIMYHDDELEKMYDEINEILHQEEEVK